MYVWIWRHLPGPVALRLVLSLLLTLGVLYLLFEHLFPYLDPRLPFNQVAPEGIEG
ncbi:MAG: hypothetical protein ACT4PP_08430 [Sporichthyaceae bacterium]